jgi:hypothetical protein
MISIELSSIMRCNITLLPHKVVSFYNENRWKVLTRRVKLDMTANNKRVSSCDTCVPFLLVTVTDLNCTN